AEGRRGDSGREPAHSSRSDAEARDQLVAFSATHLPPVGGSGCSSASSHQCPTSRSMKQKVRERAWDPKVKPPDDVWLVAKRTSYDLGTPWRDSPCFESPSGRR